MDKIRMQEMFDTAARGVLAQGEKCMGANSGSCVYQNGEKSCGVGHVLREAGCLDESFNNVAVKAVMDGRFNRDMQDGYIGEQVVVRNLNLLTALQLAGVEDEHDLFFLKELQEAHDYASTGDFAPSFKRLMTRVAHNYKLSTAVLD